MNLAETIGRGRWWRHGRTVVADRFELWAGVELRNADRLHLGWYWWDDEILAVEVSWGNGNSDPVAAAGFAVRLPRKMADWLAEHGVG